ncbi:MAG: Rho termination factor N-terminal domain-containing protein, partial [Brevundimonas sp.]
MTDITDTPETDAPSGAETPEVGNETAAADLPMVDQESGDDEDDGEPIVPNGRITLQELNEKTPEDLVAFAESLEIENAGNLRKQDLLFAILKTLADEEVEIIADGVLEILPDGFGFLRSPDVNYLPGPDDVYVSPSQIRRFGLRSGDTIHGAVRGPREGERYFALLKVDTINFEDPETVKTKVLFDNLTPLYPEERLHMEIQ